MGQAAALPGQDALPDLPSATASVPVPSSTVAPTATAPATTTPSSSPTPAATPGSAAPTRARASAASARTCPAPRTLAQLPGAGRRIALTFDDGPSPISTRPILEILDREGVKATFFQIGENAKEYPQITREVARRGHVVANHSWSHRDFSTSSPAHLRQEVDATTTLLQSLTGERICFVRAPYGNRSTGSDAFLEGRGLTQIMWQGDTRDWSGPGTSAIVRDALAAPPRRGASVILLLHDAKQFTPKGQEAGRQTVAALPTVIREYKKLGYTFVQVDGTLFPD
ncbi:hypothetical protein GCM10025883_20010 [Mobilicoccus caccae]|uniref:NodB homology domain-containing protein n=2 Tax=Mobilicoccus caccae TaxID=1859295 RepID=A0ABQ6IQG0_9MICO|nr:hypothetical protein GCM10025883_20010 [Mobilicoccus caccae]